MRDGFPTHERNYKENMNVRVRLSMRGLTRRTKTKRIFLSIKGLIRQTWIGY